MGAPLGNQNAAKAKPWSEAIRRALVQKDGKKLRDLAEALIQRGLEGDIAALKEIGDRLEGKPVQAVETSGPNGGPIEIEEASDYERARRVAYMLAQAAIGKAKGTV